MDREGKRLIAPTPCVAEKMLQTQDWSGTWERVRAPIKVILAGRDHLIGGSNADDSGCCRDDGKKVYMGIPKKPRALDTMW